LTVPEFLLADRQTDRHSK